MTNLAAAHSAGIIHVTGSISEAGTVLCMGAPSGATMAPSAVKSGGASKAVGTAGSFTLLFGYPDVDGKQVFCVGEDSMENLGATASADIDNAPTDVSLSSSTIAENSAQGTEVGTLSTTDADAGDAFTYSIMAQDVSDAFQIAGDKLQVGSGTVDFEATPTLPVTVRTTDSGGLTFDKALTVTVTGVNEAPTDITFSATTVESKSERDAIVGSLSTVDDDVGDTFTYSITTAPSGVFYISGNEVRVDSAFDDLTLGQLVGMNVTTTDAGGLTYSLALTTEVVRSENAILVALGIIVGVLGVAAAVVAAFYVKSTSAAGGGVV